VDGLLSHLLEERRIRFSRKWGLDKAGLIVYHGGRNYYGYPVGGTMELPNWMRRKRDLFTRKELRKLNPDYPDYVIDFVYESFFLGGMLTLSYFGTDAFPEIIEEYADFMGYLALQGIDEEEDSQGMRDRLIRSDLQALLDSADKPNA
jgi:hypothetical protein